MALNFELKIFLKNKITKFKEKLLNLDRGRSLISIKNNHDKKKSFFQNSNPIWNFINNAEKNKNSNEVE